MRRLGLFVCIATLSLLGWSGCTGETHSTADAGTQPVSGGGGGQNGGAGGGGTGTGGSATAGDANTGGDGADTGIGNPDSGDVSDGAGGTDGGATPPSGGKGPFVCNHVVGLFTTSQWYFEGGFEQSVGDANWQIMWQKYSYITLWANPDSEMKFPSVKEIDILTMSRAPNNMLCKNNNDPWTVVAPSVDQAIQTVADKSGGLVVVGPKYYVPDCNTSYSFPNDTDFTKSADTFIANTLAAYYKAHP